MYKKNAKIRARKQFKIVNLHIKEQKIPGIDNQ